jgi:hypothetical protein
MSLENNGELFSDGQIAKAVYLRHMSAMKDILNLGEIKFGERKSDTYRYFKKVVMDAFYTAMNDIFVAMEKEGLLQRCSCGANIRHGYKICASCNGSGFRNSDEFNDWFVSDQIDSDKDRVPPTDDK